MGEEILTVAKVPISEVVSWMRTKHPLPPVLKEFRMEGETLVLTFIEDEDLQKEQDSQLLQNRIRKRRARRRRNRMKTRGWDVVGRITNSKGQYCAIYKPFVDALQDQNLSIEEQKRVVDKILKSNRNRPTETSVQYFLENTLEYLQKQKEKPILDKAI